MSSLSKKEMSILGIVNQRNLVTKMELVKELRNNGSEDAKSVVEATTNALVKKGHLSCLNPIGSTCFVITKSGSKILEK